MSRVRSVRAWKTSTGPTACALASRRCSLWGWRKGVPGGSAFHHCEGRLRSGPVSPPTARSLGGLLGSATHVLWARPCGCGGPKLSPWPACPVGAACRGGGGELSPGGLACHRCEGRLVSGAVPPPAARPLERAAGVPQPVCPGRGRCGRGDPAPAPQRAPLRAGVARCGDAGRASPGGGVFHHCDGGLRSGAVPPPTARPLGGLLGSATHVLWALVCGCGGRTHSPWPACPVEAACRGGDGVPSPGGVACHRCEGRLMSGAVPPPDARPLERAARVPRPVCPGCDGCGRGAPAPAPQRAPLRAGVAPCGGGGGAFPGGVAVRRGGGRLGSDAPPPLAARPLGGLPGLAGHVLWAQVWVFAVCVVSVRCVSWCAVPLFSCLSGAPLSGPSVRCCARRVPAVPPSLRVSLARLLATPCFFRGFVALYLFLYPSPWQAPFPCLRSGACLGLFSLLAGHSLSLGPVRQRNDGGMWAFGGWARSSCNILYPRWHHLRCAAALSVAWRITYLSSHLCLRVCALSSPFVPYHGVLVRGGGGCVALARTYLFVVFPLLDPR